MSAIYQWLISYLRDLVISDSCPDETCTISYYKLQSTEDYIIPILFVLLRSIYEPMRGKCVKVAYEIRGIYCCTVPNFTTSS